MTYILVDPPAERAILSGIYHYGANAYFDVADILDVTCFSIKTNEIIFLCLKHILEKDSQTVIDMSSIHSAATELNQHHIFKKNLELEHLNAIIKLEVEFQNIRKFAVKIKKLQLTRLLCDKLEKSKNKLYEIEGSESFNEILAIPENELFEFTSNLDDTDANPVIIGDNLRDYIEQLRDNPVSQVGIPTGFQIYDKAIGGGMLPGSLNVIAARMKVGKSILGLNMGFNVAKIHNIPVLNLDTEMNQQMTWHRLLANESNIDIEEIKTGKFSLKPDTNNRVSKALDVVEKIPYHYKSISGLCFEEQMAIMRRWIMKDVGLNNDGTAKNCLIVYDYIKVMGADANNSSDMKEYQFLGLLVTKLKDFANRYQIPILTFAQMNRDGLNSETSATLAGSDRIGWFGSNVSLLKNKSVEEVAEDGVQNGNMKLVPILCRDGPGLEDGEYINLQSKKWCAKMTELNTNFQSNTSDNNAESVDF